MDTKTLCGVEIKDADRGEVTAVFSTLGVVDSDGDVTRKGAFTDGAAVVISAYGHTSWNGALPVGKGIIRAGEKDAVLEGQFFMATTPGRDTFAAVKALGELGQWSYGYDVTEHAFGEHDGKQVRFLDGLKVHEVSPVLVGAGVGTRTLAAKGQNLTFADEGAAVLAAVAAYGGRAADVMAMRQAKGKGLSPESAGLVEQIEAELKRLRNVLGEVPEPAPQITDDVTREWLRAVARGIA